MIDEYYKHKKDYDKIGNNRRKGILALIGSCEGKKILDVGCGRGHLGKIFKEKSSCVVDGIDISEEAVADAKHILNAAYVADLEKDDDLPYGIRQNQYDVIVISEVLEHLFFPEKLLDKIKPLCGTHTQVVITVPNILFIKNRLRIFFGHFEYEERGIMDRGHIHFFSWKSLQDMMRQAGFVITASHHNIPIRLTQMIGRILPGLLAKQFIISARYED